MNEKRRNGGEKRRCGEVKIRIGKAKIRMGKAKIRIGKAKIRMGKAKTGFELDKRGTVLLWKSNEDYGSGVESNCVGTVVKRMKKHWRSIEWFGSE